ncbi:actin-binding Rho-activating protein [Genypterus blacodes]|uniref:actin-binding Rho-activating protein n=1 Tax=Genypterus blacodes TaxID=154954 RepID=UPI003F76E785
MMGTNNQTTIIKETGNNKQSPQLSDDTGLSIGSVKDLKENWQKWTHEHREYQEHNPFSHNTRPTAAVPQKGQDTYGRPLVGSMTELRGKDAHSNISREVRQLCEVIRDIGEPRDKDGAGDGADDDGKVMSVHFGKLFEHYVTISNKVVGILLRARKQGLVDFQGEMLWQGRDDHVVITLL